MHRSGSEWGRWRIKGDRTRIPRVPILDTPLLPNTRMISGTHGIRRITATGRATCARELIRMGRRSRRSI